MKLILIKSNNVMGTNDKMVAALCVFNNFLSYRSMIEGKQCTFASIDHMLCEFNKVVEKSFGSLEERQNINEVINGVDFKGVINESLLIKESIGNSSIFDMRMESINRINSVNESTFNNTLAYICGVNISNIRVD